MRHRVSVPLPPGTPISIHAPREGCDLDGNGEPVRRVISIHAPREGCDFADGTSTNNDTQISIHAPREGCDDHRVVKLRDREISIHAPREGCDIINTVNQMITAIFQSTHPVRGATRHPAQSPER